MSEGDELSDQSKRFLASSRYIYALLNQKETWIDRQSVEHRITEMEVSYRLNVRRFLLKRAEHLFLLYGFGEALYLGHIEDTFGVPDDFDIPSVMDDPPEHPEDFERWMRGTALFKALEEGVALEVVRV